MYIGHVLRFRAVHWRKEAVVGRHRGRANGRRRATIRRWKSFKSYFRSREVYRDNYTRLEGENIFETVRSVAINRCTITKLDYL